MKSIARRFLSALPTVFIVLFAASQIGADGCDWAEIFTRLAGPKEDTCAGEVVDLNSDPSNCGSCGNICAGHRACAASVCSNSACQTGYADCDSDDVNGCEVSLLSNPTHCGSCGKVCSGNRACAGGTCTGTCARGYADCDGDGANGCEADLDSILHCGNCNRVCAGYNADCWTSSSGQSTCFTSPY